MAYPSIVRATYSFPSNPMRPGMGRGKSKTPLDEEPSRKPDWLMIFMGVLFLLTLLVVWLVNIPSLLR